MTNAGDHNVVMEWLQCPNGDTQRNWDLLINFYGEEEQRDHLLKYIISKGFLADSDVGSTNISLRSRASRILRLSGDQYRSGKCQKFEVLAEWFANDPQLFNDGRGRPYLAVGVFDDDAGNVTVAKINVLFETLMTERLTRLSPTWTGSQYFTNIPLGNCWYRWQTLFDMGFMVFRTQSLVAYLKAHPAGLNGAMEQC